MRTNIQARAVPMSEILLLSATIGAAAVLVFAGVPQATAASAADRAAYGKSVDDVVGQVAQARQAFLDAQAKVCEALGLKTQAAIKLSEAKRAIEGTTSSSEKVAAIKDSIVVSSNANQMLKQSMDKSAELSAEAKEKFGDGTAKCYEGSLLEKAQLETIERLVMQGKAMAQSSSFLEKPKVVSLAAPVTTLGGLVPGDFKEGLTTLSSMMKFAKKQNITVPKADAIEALLAKAQ